MTCRSGLCVQFESFDYQKKKQEQTCAKKPCLCVCVWLCFTAVIPLSYKGMLQQSPNTGDLRETVSLSHRLGISALI